MLKNYLLVALRNMKRHKLFAFINILGLAVGIAASLLILEYVQFEWSFDRFHDEQVDIYRVINDRYQNGERIQRGMITYPMVGPTMAEEIPEVEKYTRLMPGGRMGIRYNSKVYSESGYFFADENFFSIFSFPILAGSPEAMKELDIIAISETLAEKYFGLKGRDAEQAIGKILEADEGQNPLKVGVIFADIPENSHLQFDLLISFNSMLQRAIQRNEGYDNFSHTWSDFYHYVKLSPESNPTNLADRLTLFGEKHFREGEVSGSVEKFSLQPLAKAHLYSDLEYEIGIISNGNAVMALFVIAIFILIIAWINYINLTTARAMERAREVGIRKVVGAGRSQLIRQFMIESLLVNATSIVIAITLVQLFQPSFNQWLSRELSLGQLWVDPLIRWLLLGVALPGTLLSGLYPAFVLSGYRPVSVLKGKFSNSTRGNLLRKGLVVFQFASSILLIMGTFLVYQQLTYMQDKDLGMNMDQVLIVEGPYMTAWDSSFIHKVNTFKAEISRFPAIYQAASSSHLPGTRLPRFFNLHSPRTGTDKNISSSRMNVDFDFADVLDLKIIAGRNFRQSDHHEDFNSINHLLVNAALAKDLGYPEVTDIVGEFLQVYGRDWQVVGVVADFHQRSLKLPMEPILFVPTYSTYAYFSIKISEKDIEKSIANIQSVYEQIFPGNPFEYEFMDQRFARQYREDRRFGQLFAIFASLAIFIACLGLFGLSSYSLLNRTKEIGIRKVLGASVWSIYFLLSRQHLSSVLIAYLIAIPLAIWGMNSWLSQYAYAMEISWVLWTIPGIIILGIALFTISFQTIHTARANPVEALKYE